MNEICHIEIPVLDLSRAGKFYAELFGWKLTPWEGQDYLLFNTGKEPGGGLFKVEEIKQGSMIWYVNVEDIQEMLKKAESLGGKAVQGKTEIPNVGFWASFEDTEGNLIGLYSKK